MTRSKTTCPICGQHNMDFYATTYHSHPYIDGVTYSKMCFGCAHIPKEFIQKYDKAGEVEDEVGPLFSHQNLYTAQDLLEQGSVETIAEGRTCVAGVRARLKQVGKVALKKLKLKRPDHVYDFEDEPEPERKSRKKVSKPTGKTPRKKKPVRGVKFGAKKVKK